MSSAKFVAFFFHQWLVAIAKTTLLAFHKIFSLMETVTKELRPLVERGFILMVHDIINFSDA